jgi:hypothetical protein
MLNTGLRLRYGIFEGVSSCNICICMRLLTVEDLSSPRMALHGETINPDSDVLNRGQTIDK